MADLKVLLAGESWTSSTTHYKGFDFFMSTYYEEGAGHLIKALEAGGITVEHMPGHQAATSFPFHADELGAYDVVVLSDLGANTLLLSPDTFLRGKRTPNRLAAIRDYVHAGGGLLMAGGYMSFQGIYGAARFGRTPVEEALPVTILNADDRVEVPEGADPKVEVADHPVLAGIEGDWPYLLGFNEVQPKPGSTTVLTAGAYPLLSLGEFGNGRSAAWTSDIGPHWCPTDFVSWSGYPRLFQNLVRWLAKS